MESANTVSRAGVTLNLAISPNINATNPRATTIAANDTKAIGGIGFIRENKAVAPTKTINKIEIDKADLIAVSMLPPLKTCMAKRIPPKITMIPAMA